MNRFSKASKRKLSTCHEDLQLIMNTAIDLSPVDFGIADGHRPVERQLKYFNDGKSKIDGVNKKGKHNYFPSLAVDFYPYVNGKADYSHETVSYVSGFIMGIASMLLKQGRVTHKIRWGGNWDMDGEILTDQSFDDRPHIELL